MARLRSEDGLRVMEVVMVRRRKSQPVAKNKECNRRSKQIYLSLYVALTRLEARKISAVGTLLHLLQNPLTSGETFLGHSERTCTQTDHTSAKSRQSEHSLLFCQSI